MKTIILVSIDNLRSDCVGANPRKNVLTSTGLVPPDTPNLSALAGDGVFLPNCFTGAPYTTASHATMLTGLQPPRHGIREYFRTALRASALTLFERFAAHGWRTALATDFPALLGPVLGFTRGVDKYIEERDEEVFAVLDRDDERPLFLFWHFGSVHNPFGLSSLEIDGDRFESETRRVAGMAGVPMPSAVGPEWMERRRSDRERLLRQWYFRATDAMYEQRRYQELMTLYIEGVTAFDGGRLARVLGGIRDRGLGDERLLALTADHGEEYSDRAFAHFNGLWDGIVNVPLILCGGGISRGKRIDDLCRSCDIAPTLLDYAGIGTAPGALDGISLRNRIETGRGADLVAFGETQFGYGDQIRSFLESSFASGFLEDVPPMVRRHASYARDRRWKLIVDRDLEASTEVVALYDTSRDPLEAHDVAALHPRVVAALREEIARRECEIDDPDAQMQGEELRRLGAALVNSGYLRGSKKSVHTGGETLTENSIPGPPHSGR